MANKVPAEEEQQWLGWRKKKNSWRTKGRTAKENDGRRTMIRAHQLTKSKKRMLRTVLVESRGKIEKQVSKTRIRLNVQMIH